MIILRHCNDLLNLIVLNKIFEYIIIKQQFSRKAQHIHDFKENPRSHCQYSQHSGKNIRHKATQLQAIVSNFLNIHIFIWKFFFQIFYTPCNYVSLKFFVREYIKLMIIQLVPGWQRPGLKVENSSRCSNSTLLPLKLLYCFVFNSHSILYLIILII